MFLGVLRASHLHISCHGQQPLVRLCFYSNVMSPFVMALTVTSERVLALLQGLHVVPLLSAFDTTLEGTLVHLATRIGETGIIKKAANHHRPQFELLINGGIPARNTRPKLAQIVNHKIEHESGIFGLLVRDAKQDEILALHADVRRQVHIYEDHNKTATGPQLLPRVDSIRATYKDNVSRVLKETRELLLLLGPTWRICTRTRGKRAEHVRIQRHT